MFVPQSFSIAVGMVIFSAICWGSWANTFKGVKNYRYELFYWDYVWGILVTAIVLGLTLGRTDPASADSFFLNLHSADTRNLVYALVGGIVFNIGNILLVAAIETAGLAVAFPIGIGLALVIFAFNLALPISALAGTITRSTLGIALAVVMLAFLMMITRSKAVPQVIGFLAMENGLFFAATSATYGMPMVVELGIALDVLIGMFILGIFFFQIRAAFDSLDLRHMEKLKED